ncbi:MAG: serine hydrolase domain-containing protein [Bacteroidales bacterium]|nr:serine hydrolase domain-containing protein [Bacteroidales bacterium]
MRAVNTKKHTEPGTNLIYRIAAHKGNVLFMMLAFALLLLAGLAAREDISDTPAPEIVKETLLTTFTDDELFFFEDSITRYLLAQRFNGSVLVARHGTVLVNRSFGFSDFRNHTPLRQETPFQLASITKTFTATAVLMLHHEGLLSIDDTLTKHIPEFPWPNITVRHLLTHTSGLQNYMWMVERYWQHRHRPNNEDMLQLFLKYPRPVDFRAGSRFAYSNTGYAFLGLLIERVSGQSYADFIHQHIFEPLEMHHSFVYNPHSEAPMTSDRAYGFRLWRNRYIVIPDVHHDGVMGDKGIYSNTLDLYKWDRAISNNRLLPDSLWQQAFEYTLLANGRPVRYGMGWRLQSYLDNHVVHHPGRWNGFRTAFKRFVDDDATLILLGNTSRDLTRLINDLQSIIFYREIAERSAPPEEEDPLEYEVIGGGQ